ncbi:hypothetical protein I5M32_11340 [Pedobacter sp. SD-b]|uniref:Uncharacterized protein n=1 Tax=Pedobacter segetis TaxID=2793069 RepID=A0ABS1BL28_9SPHI|nr:hypothetical protein [Pedobacter segetis]MBK0383551.1 hypothetical protein [Pedobacter segetis]
MNKKLRFAINWNMKLTNNVWPTIRLKDENKYRLNQNYDVVLEDNLHHNVYGDANCVFIKHYNFNDLPEPLLLLDMALNKPEALKMLKHLYADKIEQGLNIETALFSFMLFKWKPQQQDIYQQTFAPGINQVLQKTA